MPILPGAAVAGRVVTAPEGAAVPGARVEAWGRAGAETVTLADGTFLLRGLPDGDYSLRVIPAAHERSAVQTFTVAGADAVLPDIAVHAPQVSFDQTAFAETLLQGRTNVQTLAFANAAGVAAGPFAWSAWLSPLRRVALISDGGTLLSAVAPLQAMGLKVFRVTKNFERVQQL